LIGENVNIVKRSRSSACEMYWKPRLTSPTTYSSGTNTSSMKTSFVRSSPIVQMPLIVMPGWSSGTSMSVIPMCLLFGSVRVPSQYHSAKCADVVHVFWPLSSHPSLPLWCVRSAFKRIDAASLPAFGSL
jgi:hypothetical protein